ncbi:hypothetical protein FW800_11565 [Pseudomonas sp. 910_23]|uniref:hypothetical protein n=1 Tax=Pseudomonas sp. 910_23 TaxID=2604461 RepID=UPI0040646378
MAIYELRVSAEDFENDGSKEIVMETYINNDLDWAVYASSSKHDGIYDTASAPDDVDGDGDYDNDDKTLYLNVANAFAKMTAYAIKKRKKAKK